MSDIATMTANELVERLARFDHLRIMHQEADASHPVLADYGDGTSRIVFLEQEEQCLVNLCMANRACFVGQAPTLSAALEEALRKAEG